MKHDLRDTRVRIGSPIIASAILAAGFLFLARAAHGDWPPNGVPVCTATGDQQSISIASDGAGGAFVAWVDYRTGIGKVYLQRLTVAGVVPAPWPANGVRVSNTPALTSEDSPQVIGDDAGGVIVAWADTRYGSWDIFALRFTAGGTIASGWASDGFPLCTLDNQELPSGIAPDGSSGAYVVWRQDRSSPFNDHFARAQHVGANGQLVSGWPLNGLQTLWGSSGGAPPDPPSVGANGKGDAVIGFEFKTTGGRDLLWSALHFAETRTDLGGIRLVNISSGLRTITAPVADSAGGMFFMFPDYRGGTTSNVYGQHTTLQGTLVWGDGGLPVCGAPENQLSVVETADRSGGVVGTWLDMRSGHGQIYGEHLKGSGVVASGWDSDGTLLGAAEGNEAAPALVDDVQGGGYVAWEDTRGADSDIYAVHFDSTGHVVPGWTPGGTPVCALGGEQSTVKAVLDGVGGAIVAWVDHRGASYDIYAQHLAPHSVGTVAVPAVPPRDQGLAMSSPVPNPSSGGWGMNLALPGAAEATLTVCDVNGALIERRTIAAGMSHVWFDASRAPGLYFVTLTQRGQSITRRVCAIR